MAASDPGAFLGNALITLLTYLSISELFLVKTSLIVIRKCIDRALLVTRMSLKKMSKTAFLFLKSLPFLNQFHSKSSRKCNLAFLVNCILAGRDLNQNNSRTYFWNTTINMSGVGYTKKWLFIDTETYTHKHLYYRDCDGLFILQDDSKTKS